MAGGFPVDPDFRAYAGFFDLVWARRILRIVRRTPLSAVTLNLCAAWKGLSNARHLPVLMVELVRTGIVGAEARQPTPRKVLNALAGLVLKRPFFAKVKVPRKARAQLRQEILDLEEQLAAMARGRPEVELPASRIWDELRADVSFAGTLWMAEVNAYTGVYFAYEDYLVITLKGLLDRERLRATELAKEMRASLGQSVVDRCWADRRIEKARLVRHALVHNGRRMTADLAKFKSEIRIERGEIVVLPAHTDELYHLLKDAATDFVVAVLARAAADRLPLRRPRAPAGRAVGRPGTPGH